MEGKKRTMFEACERAASMILDVMITPVPSVISYLGRWSFSTQRVLQKAK